MGFFTQLQERYLIKPVADRLLKSLTPPLSQIQVPDAVAASEGLQVFSVPVGFNSSMATYNKRMTSNGSVDWVTMRSISVNHETTRAAINVRKREITQLNFDIVDVSDDGDATKNQAQRKAAKELITNIGGPNVRFREILDKLIEDTLVLDACVFYKQRTRDGKLFRIIPIDGGTIKLRVDEAGMTPVAPAVAYEQWIRGEKTANLTTEDLTYEMMNPRTDNPYGLSPIESLIMTLDSSMRAMLYNLSYLSDNTVPQGFLNMPDNWNINQIKEYTEYLHALISGPKQQAKIFPIPGGANYVPTSKPTDFSFKDFFDYLDRKVCMVFDVTPQELGLSLQQYKENGETQDKIQTRKGIKPLANFLQEIFTDLLRDELGYPNFSFKFTGLDARFTPEDAKTLIPIGVVNIDEVRNDMGLAKIDAPNIIITASGITPVDQIEANAAADLQIKQNPPQPKENLGVAPDDKTPKATKAQTTETMQKISGPNKLLDRLEKSAKYKQFHSEVRQALTKQILPFIREATIDQIIKTEKADIPEDINEDAVDSVLPTIKIQGFEPYLKWAATQGGQQAFDVLGINSSFTMTDPKFTQLLGDRENYLIDSVDTTTKDWIVKQLSDGHAAQMTNAEIAQQIHDQMPEITKVRANMITNTETTNATQEATQQTYKEQGVTRKIWVLSEDIGDECGVNADQGPIPIDDEFDSGDMHPPAHVNCRCYEDPDIDSLQAMDKPTTQKGWVTINGAHVLVGGDTTNPANGSGQPVMGATPELHTTSSVQTPPHTLSNDFSTQQAIMSQAQEHIASDLEGKLRYGKINVPANIGEMIRNVDISSAKDPLELGEKILSALPKEIQNDSNILSTISDLKNYQTVFNSKK